MAKLVYSFPEYINNPAGKGSAITISTNSEDQYQKELIALESSSGRITYKIYKVKQSKTTTFYFHFLIPSKSTKGFYNDVVIELTSDTNDTPNIRTINAYTVKFFCNDANFIFTYAYAYKTHGLLIKQLENKLPMRSLLQPAGTRNPDNAMGYNKNIYFCYLIMKRDNLFDKITLNQRTLIPNISGLIRDILPYAKKEEQRRKIEDDIKKAKIAAKGKASSSSLDPDASNLFGQFQSKIAKTVKTSKVLKPISKLKPITKKRKLK